MNALLVVIAAIAIARGGRWGPAIGATAAFTALVGPIGTVFGLGGMLVARLWQRARRRDDERRRSDRDALRCVETVALGVSAGLTFHDAARLAVGTVGGDVGSALAGAIRRSGVGIDSTTGIGVIDTMIAEAERSQRTGAPLAATLDTQVASARADRAAISRQRLARLPVKLVFPLALLILPGFVLTAVGPAVISGLSRIGI